MKSLRDPTLSLPDLDSAAKSTDLEERIWAMKALLIRTRREPSLGTAALPTFRHAVRFERHGWPAVLAARGIEEIEGAVAARPVWTALLERESPEVVRSAAASVTDRWYLPVLVDLLARRDEPEVRGAVIRALGTIADASVFPAIIKYLDDPALRAQVIQALAEQGDRRAIPYLEPLVDDETETGSWDDRGAPIRIGGLAWEALRRFNEPDFDRLLRFDPARMFDDAIWSDYVAPKPSVPAPVSTAPRHSPAPRSAPPASPAPTPAPPVAWPSQDRAFHPLSLVPLGLALVELVWAFALLATAADAARQAAPTRAETHMIDALGMIPGVCGILAAIVIPCRYPLKTRDWIAIIVGALACLPLVIAFGTELLTP